MGGDEEAAAFPLSGGRKTYWRSASWSPSQTSAENPFDVFPAAPPLEKGSVNVGKPRRCPAPPLTPRSHSSKVRSCLPPLQPLSITRRSLDEWPSAGSDDVGEWPQRPPTPGAGNPGDGLKLDLTTLRTQVKKDRIAFFDKECSKVAEHIYLGGDSVARNREILCQNGITHVLNCVGFVCPEYFKSDLVYKTLWLQDSPTEDITSILYDVFDYFEDVREQKGRVLVHCCQGVSRSTSLVIAYLMWREGQSFDDAFQFVKAARGITNPNMGFACQLLQCQKRVHAIPLSPNSVLRMYRMAPHSPYDPLHLVPKMLNDPLPDALDSRGAFILHVLSSIYVWIGKDCEPMMEKDAKAAAFQVVRYERVPGPIVTVDEGHEPSEFWDAFSSAPLTLVTAPKVNKEGIISSARIGVGKRKVEAYDVDFELFYKAITGGVVPPFPSSGPGHETHLPARENNWSVLRRKFISGTFCRVYSDSALVRDVDPRVDRIQLLTSESLISPPYLSPSSHSSDSSSSSKCILDSPSLSPSTSSSPSLTPSSAVYNLPDPLLPSSRHTLNLSSSLEPGKPCLKAPSLPSKSFSRSIAERRGSISPLKLPTCNKGAPVSSRKAMNGSSSCFESPQEVLERGNDNFILNRDTLDNISSIGQVPDFKFEAESTNDSSENHVDPLKNCLSENSQIFSSSTGLIDVISDSPNPILPLVYRYPQMEKLATLGREDLDSKAMFIFLTPNKGKGGEPDRMLYLWIGSGFEQDNGQPQLKTSRGPDKVDEIDWNRVGFDFLVYMGLPKDLPIKVTPTAAAILAATKMGSAVTLTPTAAAILAAETIGFVVTCEVVKEQESGDFLELLSST